MPDPATRPPLCQERAGLLAELTAALATIELVPLEGARFLQTHQLFEGRSNQRERIIESLCDEFTRRVPAGTPCRVLSVGSGSGVVDVAIAEHLGDHCSQLRYVGVNPNRVECAAFESRFERAALPATRHEIAPLGFDEFQTNERFEVIHFVHCLYYFPDPMAALMRARSMLADGGVLVVFQAPLEELNRLATCFYDREHGRPTAFAAELDADLTARTIEFERSRIDSRLDVTPIITGDPTIGVALRDFIVQVDGRRLPRPIQDLIDRYLRLVTISEQDRSFILHPVDRFVIGG